MSIQTKNFLFVLLIFSSLKVGECGSSSFPEDFAVNFQSFAEAVMKLNLTQSEQPPISLPCLSQLTFFVAGLQEREMWAISIFDSWSKLQSGIFSGNLANFGHFDQCVRSRHAMANIGEFQGQHCVTSFQFKSDELKINKDKRKSEKL